MTNLARRIREERDWMDDNGIEGDPYEELLDQCGMTRDGGCQFAGSEYCDWNCPFNALTDPDPSENIEPDPDAPSVDPAQREFEFGNDR